MVDEKAANPGARRRPCHPVSLHRGTHPVGWML